MSTATLPENAPVITHDPVIELNDISWEMYCQLREQERNQHIHMIYNQGKLHLMAPGMNHERVASIMLRMVWIWSEENRIPMISAGSTTLKSELLKVGLEPDQCFFIQNETAVRSTDNYDPETDPPPDLAIEVDYTSFSIAKLPIYAALGVPEIWRWANEEIEVLRLDGKAYQKVDHSDCLSDIPFSLMLRILQKRFDLDDMSLGLEFRKQCQGDST